MQVEIRGAGPLPLGHKGPKQPQATLKSPFRPVFNMDEPLQAHSINEVDYYLMVTACPKCGKGPWETDTTGPSDAASNLAIVRAHCTHCRARKTFTATWDYDLADEGPQAEQINPSPEPSRIIDLGQWVSLFALMIESAASAEDRVQARLVGYRAALCLSEALKFYGDDQLPPESAFFSDDSIEAFRNAPERYARQRLRDMQGKLPKLDTMASNVSRDQRGKRKWWRFWR